MLNINLLVRLLREASAQLCLAALLVVMSGCQKSAPPLVRTNNGSSDIRSETVGSDIVFTRLDDEQSTFDIFMVNGSTGRVSRLTSDGVSAMPAWSPDHTHIAFIHAHEKGTRVCVMKADGTHMREYESTDHAVGLSDWSPDGDYLVYLRRSTSQFSIVRLSLDTGEINTLWRSPEGLRITSLSRLSWSLNGRRVLFSAISEVDGRGLFLLDTTSNSKQVTPVRTTTDKTPWFPQWSPNSERFVYTDADESSAVLYVQNVESGKTTLIRTGCKRALYPVWSHDGTRFLYDGLKAGGTDLYMVDSDGGSPAKQITHVGDVAGNADW